MKDLIKRLFRDRNKTIKLILLDDSKPGQDNSYTLRPSNMFLAFLLSLIVVAALVSSILIFTPLGGLLYSPDDVAIRREIDSIAERIQSLQDSLEVRDAQLREIKKVIRTNQDTTLALDENIDTSLLEGSVMDASVFSSVALYNTFENMNSGDFLMLNVLEEVPDFPARYPVEGTTTRGYEPQQGHFGIDIATTADEPILNIADGTIITSNWTMSYGYVISVQHRAGLVTTYKHCSKLFKREGEEVQKGDILGLTGDVGTSSSGPHLHFEIWKNGVSQNPLLYLIQ